MGRLSPFSVTRRYIRFLFGQQRAETMYAPIELPLDTELMLPTTDDSHVGEDTD